MLPPATTSEIQVEFSQVTPSAGVSTYTVTAADPSAAVNWASLYTSIEPRFQPDDSWAAIYTNFIAKVGSTYGQFQSVLAQDATYLGLAGESVVDVRRLMSFEFEQADDFGTITRRYYLGAFGRGLPDPTDITALADTSGNVAIRNSGALRFFTLQTDGSFLAQPGDFGALTNAGSFYQLRKRTGISPASGPTGRSITPRTAMAIGRPRITPARS